MVSYSTDPDPKAQASDKQTTRASPHRVLEEMASRGVSGYLHIQDPLDQSVGWQLFMDGKNLNYASSIMGQPERVACLLQQFQPELADLDIKEGELEYSQIYNAAHQRKIPMIQLRQLLVNLSLEALVQVLTMNRANVQFSKTQRIDPILVVVPVKQVIPNLWKFVSKWEALRLDIPSPFSRLFLDPQQVSQFCEVWQQTQQDPTYAQFYTPEQLPVWIQLLTEKLSLYQAASRSKIQPLALATLLHPLVKAKALTVIPFRDPKEEAKNRTVIACIDDSKTVQRQVQRTLEVTGYEVLGIADPAQALTALARQRPALILMDVNMPGINGYELSQMLRKSKQLRDIPIVMLTGRDGFIDRVRAQMIGVADYITKPFEPSHLLQTVQRLAQPTEES